MAYLVFLILLDFSAPIHASNPRSVNVALETVLEFDSKNDIEFIDTLQNFLQKLKTTINRNRTENQTSTQENGGNKNFIFTEFLTNTITVLKSYKDNDLRVFFDTLEKEIKTWQARKEFHEITNSGFRRLINRNLISLTNSPATEIRRKLNKLHDKLKFNNRNGNNGFVADFLNYVYKKESEANFMNFLNNLKLYRTGTRRNNVTNLKRIIRKGILNIIDPLLKMNPKTIHNLSSIFYKYIANNDTKHENNLLNVKNEIKPKKYRHRHEFKNVLKDNEILDYIEDHVKVIDEHLTSKSLVIKGNAKSIPRLFHPIGTTAKHIHKTASKKKRKLKLSKGKSGKLTTRSREKKKQTQITELIKDTSAETDRKPVLIKLASDNSGLRSVEEYLSSTKRHKQYKASRSKLTSKRTNFYIKTTKKYRKAFRTSTLSAEGLSIEHFGSLFGRDYHRKNNDIDRFGDTMLNSTLTTVLHDVMTTREAPDGLSKEITRRNKVLSREKEEDRTVNETKNASENIEDIKTTKVEEKHDSVTESIKIKGDIIIEKPSTTAPATEITTSTPSHTTQRNYNVSIVTKYFNVQTMKPTLILRTGDVEIPNRTVVPPSTAVQTTSSITETSNVTGNESEVSNVKKTTDDGLENEIEDIMERYNNTPVPIQFESLVNNVQANPGEDSKVRNQMQADLAKLLAPPSTKSTVTQIFTDPFDDIDDAVTDII